MIVTDVFPPVAAVGVHRTVGLCRHLTDQGWKVTVITARPNRSMLLDWDLAKRVPKEVRVVRTAAPDLLGLVVQVLNRRSDLANTSRSGCGKVPGGSPARKPGTFRRLADWLSWWLHVPDRSIGWLIPAVWAGLKEARRQRPDVIFSTAPTWTSHLVGLALSKLLRVPWVADFRDPWCGSAWREIPYTWQRRVDARLEKAVVRSASRITCAVDCIRKHLAKSYPERAEDSVTILNGFDSRQIDSTPATRLDTGRCVLLHTGMLYGPRSPVPLLEGLRRFHELHPSDAKRLLVVFLGQPTYNGRPLVELARDYGVQDLARVMPPTSHRKALSYLKGADVAVLFGQGGRADLAPVPAKTYEYIGAGKPVLAIETGDEALDVMRRGGCRVWAAKDSDPEGIASTLKDIVADHDQGNPKTGDNSAARLAFTRSRMAEELEHVLAEILASKRIVTRQ